jgi:hypothetical protein
MELKFFPVVLLALVMLVIAGCQDFGQFPTPTLPAEPTPKAVSPGTSVGTQDRAVLAVYEHLLSIAQSAEAKEYLAEFYVISDKWMAEQELFKDGSSLWYVTVDSTGVKDWKGKPHWLEAGWHVSPDGKVIPSNRLKASALLIEADLQKLSAVAKP